MMKALNLDNFNMVLDGCNTQWTPFSIVLKIDVGSTSKKHLDKIISNMAKNVKP